MPDNDTWDSLARIVALLCKIDTELTAPEGMPASQETREAFLWLLNTAEYNAGEPAFSYSVGFPESPIAVRFTASLVIEDVQHA